jgi:hypothetical protein
VRRQVTLDAIAARPCLVAEPKPHTQIAAKLGIEETALIRVRAGISFVLAEAMDYGHCGLPCEELKAFTRELLEVPREVIDTALSLALQEGVLVAADLDSWRCVFLAGVYRDIWPAAYLMLRWYGDTALAESARRADELEEAGDATGVVVWRWIIDAMKQFRNTTPSGPLR